MNKGKNVTLLSVRADEEGKRQEEVSAWASVYSSRFFSTANTSI